MVDRDRFLVFLHKEFKIFCEASSGSGMVYMLSAGCPTLGAFSLIFWELSTVCCCLERLKIQEAIKNVRVLSVSCNRAIVYLGGSQIKTLILI